MKTMRRLTVVLAMCIASFFAFGLMANADSNLTATQISYTDNSVTISWTYTPEANYTLKEFKIIDYSSKAVLGTLNTSTRQATISNLTKGTVKKIQVIATVTRSGNEYDRHYDFVTIHTTPNDITTSNFGIATYNITRNTINFNASKPENASLVGITVYKYNGTKVKDVTPFSSFSESVKLSKNVVYKYCAASIYKDFTTNATYYGKNSNYRYFILPKVTTTTSSKSYGCKVKLKGISKVSYYKVYVSTSSSKKGNLIKKCAPKVGKTGTYTIDKRTSKLKMKNRVTYYVSVVPYIKDSAGKIHASDTYVKFSIYNYKR